MPRGIGAEVVTGYARRLVVDAQRCGSRRHDQAAQRDPGRYPAAGRRHRGKLVRDRIPEIILQIILRAGLVPVIETAAPKDYDRYVRAKRQEELEEYLSSGDVAEVADLVEVYFAAALHGVSQDELLAIARDKRA